MNWRSLPTTLGIYLQKQANSRNARTAIFPAMLALFGPAQAMADTNLLPPPPGSYLCRQAITSAERAHGIPPHLLAAIARVESGRRDQASGTFNPWPWTINLDGQGSFYENKAHAVAAAAAMRPRVSRSIDVGCMQISLTMHPMAFASMDQAFDPQSNADYGARFLTQLYEKTGSWPKAVEYYHSATPDLGRDYQQKVYAAWPEEKKLAAMADPPALSSLFPMAGLTSPKMAAAMAIPSITRPTIFSSFGQNTPHIIPRTSTVNTDASAGRTLESYRLTPVRLAFRPPRLPN